MTEALLPHIRRNYRDAFCFAYRMLGEREAAQDVVQEAFLRLVRWQPDGVGAEGVRRWVFTVVRNLCLTQLRCEARRRQAPIEERRQEAHDRNPAETSERSEIVREAVLSLAPDLREALILREYERMSYQEIAEIQGCALGTVKSRIARAREALRIELQPYMEA